MIHANNSIDTSIYYTYTLYIHTFRVEKTAPNLSEKKDNLFSVKLKLTLLIHGVHARSEGYCSCPMCVCVCPL